jgi:SAM-dependent methyltransferase
LTWSQRADLESNDHCRWQQRTIHSEAEFVIPRLRPDMRLADVGCGPGSVTLGLAQVVAPGRVIGVDMNTARLETARRAAAERQQDNVDFVVGDAGSLPFHAESVEVVFANGLIEHLGNPDRALVEFRRVLVSGGIVALRSPDWGTAILSPSNPRLERSIDLRNRWQRHNGGDPEVGRKLRRLLIDAGFDDVEAGATADHHGSTDRASEGCDYMLRLLQDSQLTALANQHDWATAQELKSLADAWQEWARDPGAFAAFFWCHAVGVKRPGTTASKSEDVIPSGCL